MSETARKSLFLAFLVTVFAVAMAGLLLVFKHRAALDSVQRDRIALVATGIQEVVSRSLSLGLAYGEISTLGDVLESQRSTDALIGGIDVTDAGGQVAYSTHAARVGAPLEEHWRQAMSRGKGDAWNASSNGEAVVGAVVRNSFGLALGHVVVRYDTTPLARANRAFAGRLALWGAGIALAATLLLFALLSWTQAALELRLARLRSLFEGYGDATPPPGSFSAEVAAARESIAAAHRDLDELGIPR